MNKPLQLLVALICLASGCISQPRARNPLAVIQRTVSTNQPSYYRAYYADSTTSRLISPGQLSTDNGRTWNAFTPQTKFQTNLPFGYRRDSVTTVLDPHTGRLVNILNSLDTPNLDPKAHEPKIAQQTYYLRYRVSLDAARTWLLDEPIVEQGSFDAKHPVDGVWIGTNAIYLGDVGCIPVATCSGKILVPTQATPIGPDNKLYNPSGGHTYTDVLVLIGTWTNHNRLTWKISDRVRSDPLRTTRGLIEPTLTEFPDGRILMVMRGSNGGKSDPHNELPSSKWTSISINDGLTWSKPEPLTYDDGTPAYSPSSMSALLMHSSGRCFWAGNLTATNCAGNLPRYPLVIGEVDPQTFRLIRKTIVTIDTHRPEDDAQGRLDISHLSMFEDRETHEIVLTYPRAHHAYKDREWRTVRLTF